MGTKYTSVSVTGYNASAPADDGSATSSNQIKWSTIKTKLPDPLKTALESINSNLATFADFGGRQITGSDTTLTTDHMKTVEIASTVTASITVSLADAVTVAAGYVVTIKNSSAVTQTIGRATSGDTIDGVAGNYKLPAFAAVTVKVLGTNYQITNTAGVATDNAFAVLSAGDRTKIVKVSAVNLTTDTTRTITAPDADITLSDRALTQQFATASGTNTYVTGFGPVPAAYVLHGFYLVRFTNANTSASATLNIDSLGAKPIVRQGGAALYVGDITANMYGVLQYDGTNFVLHNPAVVTATRYVSSNQTITAAGTLTFTHGLPGTPKSLWYSLVNVSAEYGWNGEELFFNFGSQDNTSSVARGAMAWADATNIYVLFAKGNPTFNISQKTSDPGGQAAATNASWRFKVYAEL